MKLAVDDLLLATKDVARVLTCSTDLVRALERRGVLPANVLPSRQRLFRFVDVVQLARERGLAIDEPQLVAELYGDNVVPFTRPRPSSGATRRTSRARRRPANAAHARTDHGDAA